MSATTVPGSTLADRYRLEKQIGAGGMATVYLARDLKHDRSVALKVMKPDLTVVLGPERFLAEIRLTANLQHPNLLPLFDSGEAGGILYYVMPFVEGESLRARLSREKQLPIEDAVHIASAVASALEYAHSQGVIHRDLKPENILIQSGEPVVADFGIALAVSHAGGARVTQSGISLGTPQYMSPEQATGDRQIDGRADIYALGAVLYEMLTGEPPHTGNSVQAIIARVIADRPDRVSIMRPSVPEHVEFAIDKALEKLPADRWPSAREFADALAARNASTFPTRAQGRSTRGVRSTKLRLVAVAAASAVVTGLAGFAFARALRQEPIDVAFSLDIPSHERVRAPNTWPVALSSDGRSLVYVGKAGPGGERLYIRRLGELRAHALTGTDGARNPVFSPDGQWIAFFANRTLKRVAVSGGPPVEIATLPGFGTFSWSRNGRFIVTISPQAKLPRGIGILSDRGDSIISVTVPDSLHGEDSHRWPTVLDDGETFLYTSWRTGGGRKALRIGIASLGDTVPTTLEIAGVRGLGLIDDHLIYLSEDGTIRAVPFDLKRRRITGSPIPLLSGVRVGSNGPAGISLSASGSLAYVAGSNEGRLVLLRRDGTRSTLLPNLDRYGTPRVSPDGRRIALRLTRSDGSSAVWTYDTRTSTMSRVSADTNGAYPEWAADGRDLFYAAGTGKAARVFRRPIDGSGPSIAITDKWHYFTPHPNGRTLLYTEFPDSGEGRLWMRDFVGDTTPRPLPGSSGEWSYRFSPDGKWLAYLSYESGNDQVYVRPFPGPGPRIQVSTSYGFEPAWSRDGGTLFYRDSENFVAATIRTQPALEVTARRTLFEDRFDWWWDVANYDVTLDGSLAVVEPESEDRVIVISNWRAQVRRELRRR